MSTATAISAADFEKKEPQLFEEAKNSEKGFTLIELSIVLVIIGLIVGGILVGQEMIRAAEIRSVISQIEKYNTAVNVFRNKYGGIPGDINIATSFFAIGGNGDGNLVLTDTNNTVANDSTDFNATTGELMYFFAHLSSANLVDGTFGPTGLTSPLGSGANFPITNLGRGGIFAFSLNGINRYHIGLASSDYSGGGAPVFSNATLSPNESYQIDVKMDDGVPNTGNVLARTGTNSAAVATAPATNGDGNCTSTASLYNVGEAFADADTLLCQLQLRMN